MEEECLGTEVHCEANIIFSNDFTKSVLPLAKSLKSIYLAFSIVYIKTISHS